jgi:hypothetical protein
MLTAIPGRTRQNGQRPVRLKTRSEAALVQLQSQEFWRRPVNGLQTGPVDSRFLSQVLVEADCLLSQEDASIPQPSDSRPGTANTAGSASNSAGSRLLGVRAQDPPSQPRFTGGGTLGAKRPTSASVTSEQSAEEARIVALQLSEIDGLLDLVKVVPRPEFQSMRATLFSSLVHRCRALDYPFIPTASTKCGSRAGCAA